MAILTLLTNTYTKEDKQISKAVKEDLNKKDEPKVKRSNRNA